MGSFVFKWEHPASEVYVTGTFDDWRKSERLEKVGDIFEKNVTLSSADQKIYYKFVVDGNWVTDHTAPQENDESGNLNNVLTVDRIVKHQPESTGIMSGVAPTSTTANLAKDVPLESSANKSASSDLPGTFPETPAATEEKGHFSVNPLPAADGAVNPIKLAPGEKVPDSSTFTENTITSGVRHDDPDMLEELKKSVEKEKTENEQPFGVSPLPAFPGAINPIKVAPGEKLPDSSTLTGNTIQSTVKIDGDSYEKSGGVGNAPVLPPVVTPQSEREKNGTGVLDLPPISKNLIPESSLPIDTPGAGISDTGPTIQSAGPESTTSQLAANVPLEPPRVPDIVKESQERAGVDPEASAIAEEVKEKSAVEKELGSKVPEAKSADTHKNFGSLAKLLIPLLKKDSFMIENVAVALQELVNENKSVASSDQGVAEVSEHPMTSDGKDPAEVVISKPSYSQKAATRNITALASCSEELLQALTDVLFESSPEQRTYLKDTIACLASITDSSVTKRILISSLERFELFNDVVECGKLDESVDTAKTNSSSTEKDAKRCLLLELASSIVKPASNDLIDLIFNLIKQSLQEADEILEREAYFTLNKILEETSWFCSSKFVELMDLLLGLKPPLDIKALTCRFACFKALLLHSIERSSDGEDAHAFLVLNEIILTLKDAKEKGEDRRKVAYDIILGISSSLQKSSQAIPDGPYHKFVNMIMGYLSGSSPHIKSGAVSALSVVVYNDSGICHLMPDLVPSILELLYSKAIEVIKAVLGFMKVLVLSLQVKDLLKFLPDILNGILPWSSVSRHHFRLKVTVILEIMMRRCGSASVKSLAPEKYRTFVKSVLETRRGKTSSKEEAVTTETEPNLAESAPRGWQKRNHNEEDSAWPRKKRREDGWKGAARSSTEHHTSDVKREVKQFGRDKSIKSRSQGSRMNKKRKFDSDPLGGKGKMGSARGGSKKSDTDAYRPATTSSLPKHKKVGKKWQKGKK